MEKWLSKLADHADNGGCGVALVFARTETKWFQSLATRANSVFFPKGRISFLTGDKKIKGNSGAPSVFLDFGCDVKWENIMPGIELIINKACEKQAQTEE